MSGTDDEAQVLDRATCLDLIRLVPIGRLGWLDDPGEFSVHPVTIAVVEDDIIFRSTPHPPVTGEHARPAMMEIDDFEPATQVGWSVVVRGHAHPISDPAEVQRLDALVRPWFHAPQAQMIRLHPEQISGRRLRPHPGGVTIVKLGPDVDSDT